MNFSRWLAVTAALVLFASTAAAQGVYPYQPYQGAAPSYWIQPATGWKAGNAPDLSGRGVYYSPQGYVMAPNYNVTPSWCPESGFRPPFFDPGRRGGGSHCGGGGLPTVDSFPSHKYVRSPRDFFMFHENLEVERSRELRPIIVP